MYFFHANVVVVLLVNKYLDISVLLTSIKMIVNYEFVNYEFERSRKLVKKKKNVNIKEKNK